MKHIINLDKKYRNFDVKLILQHFPYAPSLPQPKKKASLSKNSPSLSLILANSQAPCRGSLTSPILITTPPAGFHLHVSAALPNPTESHVFSPAPLGASLPRSRLPTQARCNPCSHSSQRVLKMPLGTHRGPALKPHLMCVSFKIKFKIPNLAYSMLRLQGEQSPLPPLRLLLHVPLPRTPGTVVSLHLPAFSLCRRLGLPPGNPFLPLILASSPHPSTVACTWHSLRRAFIVPHTRPHFLSALNSPHASNYNVILCHPSRIQFLGGGGLCHFLPYLAYN